MKKNEFLNEETYQKSNHKVKTAGNIIIIIGLVILVLAIIFIVCGVLGVGNEVATGFEAGQEEINPGKIFSGIGSFAIGGFMSTFGIFVTVIGLIIRFLIGNRREIMSYSAQQVMPVEQEVIEKMAPTIGKAGDEIAKGIASGIKEGLKDEK